VTPPVVGVPAWHPDPSGRHELRWWDGSSFTGDVADAGTVAIDPWVAPPPPAAAAAEPAARRGPGRALVVVGVLVLAVVAAAVSFVLLRGDDDGTGTFTGEVATDRLGTHELSADAGTAIAVRVSPGADADVVIGVAVTDDVADRLDVRFRALGGGLDPADAFPAADDEALAALDGIPSAQVVLRTDVGFAGEEELLLLVTPFELDAAIVVAPFGDDDEDEYEITIETFPVDVDENDEGDELLEAVTDDRDIPSDVRELAEELRDLLVES
jgi:hypothetical protein